MIVWNDVNNVERPPQVMMSMTEWRQKAVELNLMEDDPSKMRDSVLEDLNLDHGEIFIFSDVMILKKEKA